MNAAFALHLLVLLSSLAERHNGVFSAKARDVFVVSLPSGWGPAVVYTRAHLDENAVS